MLRRFTAVLIFHFLFCVGVSAVGLNVPYSAPHWPDVTQQNTQSAPEAPSAFLDASDHALMDDQDDLPDQLQVLIPSSIGTSGPLQAGPPQEPRSLSAIVIPLRRPPKQA